MIRFAVFLFFFFHLAILIKAPKLRWLGRVTGYGTALLFLGLFLFPVADNNSDYVFVFAAVVSAISIFLAEILASFFKK